MHRRFVVGSLLLATLATACSDASDGAQPPGPSESGGSSPLAGASGAGGKFGLAGSSGSAATAGGYGGATAGMPSLGGGGSASGSAGAAGSAGTAGVAGAAGTAMGGSSGGAAVPACETNEKARCSGTAPITCDFGGEPGDYVVTVELGGATSSKTYIEAETLRRVLGNVELEAGESRRFAFGVNVREPEGQPIQEAPRGKDGLQLYLRGSAPALTAVCVKPYTAKPKVWIAGDSTVCDQSSTAFAGWGQHLPQHFKESVVVANYADSGESSATVLASPRMWGTIKAGWRPGDWVLVQVGHNDKTVTTAAFRSNITAFVTQAKAAGVNIALCTPIARVGYALAAQHQSSADADIPAIIKDVARTENVPVIDLTTATWNWLQTVDWKPYFANGTDRTHTNPAGAEVVAGLVRDAIFTQKLELAAHLR